MEIERQAIERLTSLYDLSKAFGSTIEGSELAGIVARKAVDFAGAEAGSLLRLVVLYLLAFVSVGSVLGSGGVALYVLLRFALGERMGLAGMLGDIGVPLSVALSFGGIWAYYGRLLNAEIKTYPGLVEAGEQAGQRAAALRRLYYYVLSFLGLGAAFIGLPASAAIVRARSSRRRSSSAATFLRIVTRVNVGITRVFSNARTASRMAVSTSSADGDGIRASSKPPNGAVTTSSSRLILFPPP